MTYSPDTSVLEAFDVKGEAQSLPGGQNNSWKVGDFVLKYVGPDPSHEWVASTLSEIEPEQFRIPKPVVSRNKNFVYDGWTCSSFEPGAFVKGQLIEKLEASRLFHRSLTEADLSRYRSANDRWQVAHRIAWSPSSFPPEMNSNCIEYLTSLLKNTHPSRAYPVQVIHGDLAGNIFFQDGLYPLIIDFSPTLAPIGYAEAILVVDSIAWHDSPTSTLKLLPQDEFYRDMLLRAMAFRLAVSSLMSDEEFIKTCNAFSPLVKEIV